MAVKVERMDVTIQDARAIFLSAVERVRTDQMTLPQEVEECQAHLQKTKGKIHVLAAGKAAIGMASRLEHELAHTVNGGLVVVPHGYLQALPGHVSLPQRIPVIEAGHPVPDKYGLDAASKALKIAEACGPEDVLLVLLSGGASALWPAPADSLTLEHLAAANRALLACGADIHQINTLRKHLSRIKGGQLATAAWPARTLTLAISDVTGDDMSVIGSGPTTADATTFEDCLKIADTLGLELSSEVMKYLERGVRGQARETPNLDDDRLLRARSVIVASNSTALTAAAARARSLGYEVIGQEHDVTGEACRIGIERATQALQMGDGQCLLWGGESTVVVTGGGRGGRNQELVLAAACELDDAQCRAVVLSGGTDGIDGPTDAAGAWATPETIRKGQLIGLDAKSALRHNDSYTYFDAMNQLIRTGPTHTNVMDIGLVLTGKSNA